MDRNPNIEPIQAELVKAYERLKSIPPGDETAEQLLAEITRLERELIDRYSEYIEERDSTLPEKS